MAHNNCRGKSYNIRDVYHKTAHLVSCNIASDSHLADLKDFTVGLLHAIKHGHVIPKAGLCNNFVGSKDVHLEDIGFARTLLLARLQSTNNLEPIVRSCPRSLYKLINGFR